MNFSYNSKDEIKKALSQLQPDSIKGGIARDTVDAKYRSIFDALDKKNNNGILEDNEIQDLQIAAGKNGIFSLGEIKKLIKTLGLKDSTNVETFVSFLGNIIGLSAQIENAETVPTDSGNNTVITYKEDESKQQKVEVRDSSGKLVKTVIYKNVGTENVTYEVYVNGKLTEGKDEKGEYFCNQRVGYGIMGQTVAYEKIRNTPNGQTKEYYTKEGVCIGGEDEKGLYRRSDLGDGRYKIGRDDYRLDYYEIYDSNNRVISGNDSIGQYSREYQDENNGDYTDLYILDGGDAKKIYKGGVLERTEVNETRNGVVYKKSVTSSGIEVEITGEPNSKIYIDFEKITKPFEGEEKEQLIEALKQMPSQVLLDLFIEATFTKDKIGDGTDGSFWSVTDKITLSGGSFSVDTIVHELGHALDCLGKGDNSRFQSDGKKFSSVFNSEMKQYLAQGNKRCTSGYDKDGRFYTNNDDGDNYATLNEHEMFAECYTLIMLGYCDSENVINTYFKKTLACANEIIASTRKRSVSVRHPK